MVTEQYDLDQVRRERLQRSLRAAFLSIQASLSTLGAAGIKLCESLTAMQAAMEGSGRDR